MAPGFIGLLKFVGSMPGVGVPFGEFVGRFTFVEFELALLGSILVHPPLVFMLALEFAARLFAVFSTAGEPQPASKEIEAREINITNRIQDYLYLK